MTEPSRSSGCDVCGARVAELRRGRCWGCYARWVDARPVGLGARCITCGERRLRMLRTVELYGAWPAMCFSCSGQLLALEPVPPTLAELRVALSRERRRTDRRSGRPDTRVFRYERRVGERRSSGRDDYPLVDDDMIIEIEMEAGEPPIDFEDVTRIRELPPPIPA
jgi:hypothetical protein